MMIDQSHDVERSKEIADFTTYRFEARRRMTKPFKSYVRSMERQVLRSC